MEEATNLLLCRIKNLTMHRGPASVLALRRSIDGAFTFDFSRSREELFGLVLCSAESSLLICT